MSAKKKVTKSRPPKEEVDQVNAEIAGAEVTVSTAPSFEPGEVVRSVTDERVRGQVLGVREHDGMHQVQVAGSGNWMPADGFVRV